MTDPITARDARGGGEDEYYAGRARACADMTEDCKRRAQMHAATRREDLALEDAATAASLARATAGFARIVERLSNDTNLVSNARVLVKLAWSHAISAGHAAGVLPEDLW